MRELINLITENIVHRDRIDGTIVSINPTKLEWQRAFKEGAAGVFCKDGMIVIGEGPLLAHDVILYHASIDVDMEKYRLQLTKKGAWAELWIENEWENIPTQEDLNLAIKRVYGHSLGDIEREVSPVLQKFMGNVPFKAIPINYDSAKPFTEADLSFIDGLLQHVYYKTPISESVEVVGDPRYTVHIDPSPDVLEKLVKKSKEKILKGLYHLDTQKVYLWDAYFAWHETAKNDLSLEDSPAEEFIVGKLKNGTTVLRVNIRASNRIRDIVRKHPSFRKITDYSIDDHLLNLWT